MGCCEENIQIDSNIMPNTKEGITTVKKSLNKSRTNVEDFDIDIFMSRMLASHNNLRTKYKSPLLKQNDDLDNLAHEYAKEFIINKEKSIFKPYIYKGSILGENITIGDLKNPDLIFQKWAQEEKNYDFNNKKFLKSASHFTQIIWKETTDIGIGFYSDDQKKTFCTVLLYYPAGNIFGDFATNVTN